MKVNVEDAVLSDPVRLVLVEDDMRFVAGVGAALASAADCVLVGTARSVTEACALLDGQRPNVALIDMGLGTSSARESGLDVIRYARRHVPDCELLVVSLFDDDASVMAAIEAGASGYVLKGGSAEELVAHIRAVRLGGSPISPRVARRLLQRLGTPTSVRDTRSAASSAVGEGESGRLVVALSPQEMDMLQLAAKGCPYDEIARLMGVTRNTVLTYAKRCYRKLQVHSRSEAVYEARRMGLLKD